MNANRIPAVYLAAGQSSRMGKNKLALPFGKTTIGSSALKAALASKLEHIIVVTKEDDLLEWLDPSFFQSSFREKWTQVRCRDAAKGQSYSLKCGVRAVLDRNPAGIMVLLADQPFLTAKTINELIFQSEQICKKKGNQDVTYIAAGFQGTPRPPILFFKQLFPQLLQLTGDEGARRMLRKPASLKGLLVENGDEKIFFDIDTNEDYRRL